MRGNPRVITLLQRCEAEDRSLRQKSFSGAIHCTCSSVQIVKLSVSIVPVMNPASSFCPRNLARFPEFCSARFSASRPRGVGNKSGEVRRVAPGTRNRKAPLDLPSFHASATLLPGMTRPYGIFHRCCTCCRLDPLLLALANGIPRTRNGDFFPSTFLPAHPRRTSLFVFLCSTDDA